MSDRIAKANVPGFRQETQFTCMSCSLSAALRAHGKDQTEADVNRVMGAGALRGATWEDLTAAAQYFGMRSTLVIPATIPMLKKWTDAGTPVIIAYNPEGRPWSHASVVFDVEEDGTVHVMDPNIPDPSETVRVMSKADFYKVWGEPLGDKMIIRRPACAIEREVTAEGRQMVAFTRRASFSVQSKYPAINHVFNQLLCRQTKTIQAGGWRNRQLERAYQEHKDRQREQRREDRDWERDYREGEERLINIILKGYAMENPEDPSLMSLPVLWMRRRSRRLNQFPAFLKAKKVPLNHARKLQQYADDAAKSGVIRLRILDLLRDSGFQRLNRLSRHYKTPSQIIDLSTVKEIVESTETAKLLILQSLLNKVKEWPEGLAHVEKVIAEYEAGRQPSPEDLKKTRNYLYKNRMRDEANQFRQATRSPNQVGTTPLLVRQGLKPVDVFFGEIRPHRRSVIMQDEIVQDRKGNLWFFVGLDENGKAILAKNERDLERMKKQLIQDRLHVHTASPVQVADRHLSKKDPQKVTGPGPKRRNEVVRDMVQRGWGSGSHQNRDRDVQKGRSRKPKHKRDLRDQRASISCVSDRYLLGD